MFARHLRALYFLKLVESATDVLVDRVDEVIQEVIVLVI